LKLNCGMFFLLNDFFEKLITGMQILYFLLLFDVLIKMNEKFLNLKNYVFLIER